MLDCPLYCSAILYNKFLVVSVLSGLVVLHLFIASRTAPVQLIHCTTHLSMSNRLLCFGSGKESTLRIPFPGNATEGTFRQPA